jgi:hypothetical protein
VDEARGSCVPDEERGDHQVQLVSQACREELGVHRAATFDHELADVACVQVFQDAVQVDGVACVNHAGEGADSFAGLVQRG